MSLYATATTRQALADAWEELRADARADGTVSVGVTRFAADADDRLTELAEQLAARTWAPGPLTPVEIPKDDGGVRTLAIPPVADRVVEKALAAVLTPVIDPHLHPACYAYRPGLGVTDAVQHVARLRDDGLGWAVRADIDDCFPTIDTRRVRRLLAELIDDADLLTVVDRLLARTVAGRPATARGLPQGAPLSPALANLALTHLDEAASTAGFPAVRYGDDICLLAATRDDADQGRAIIDTAATELGMRLGDDTQIMSFTDGFCFLGEDFGTRYPPVIDTHRVLQPATRTVYVARPGAAVRIEAGRLLVETPDDTELLNVPTGHVESLALFGPVGLSAGARTWALTNDVEVIPGSRRGHYLGQLHTRSTRRVTRLRRQLAAADTPDRALPIARTLVAGKIRKQVVLIQRLTRREPHEQTADSIATMRRMQTMLDAAGSRDEILGLEGAAARAYFTALGHLLPAELAFTGRNRRPPLDVINAALSYGYTLLVGEAVAALAAAGLDPAIGLLHTDDDNRPSLALDLIEEFRPLIVDQVVATAARKRTLTTGHGRTDPDRPGVLLTEKGREALIDAYEHRMLHVTRGALPGFAGSLRRHLHRQAQRLAAHLDHGADWTPLSWR
ncbi:CRISPR-associated endonuclease Cas1 [Mangrovihabitans endophyticus]|uniref:CRISPR-associated endonuclease Cas1 n=1 Tax=Mangrovihabitans endophyticus TaxID=1751298 RepID=A0A8J3C5C8_9ACTN|nr:CRISPR-associated endonuclease Cas1 [Mangrovihabitans endophyticus]GGL21335.1 hypothetical protein GCM10012284_64970 [Mangrovihabitans endophyticus]